jgi:adenine-specific DNA-methyltransferase
VFGASDEVLGSIESGVDFEKRIAAIYQRCRQPDEIKAAFDQLQLELSLEINESMTQTRRKLLENFDDEVREKLKTRDADARAYLSRYERQLIAVTRHELAAHANFADDLGFVLNSSPFAGDIPLGRYELPRRSGEAHLYRLGHPLAEAVLAQAKARALPLAEVVFAYGDHEGMVSALEPLLGQSGWLTVSQFTVESLDQTEDHLIVSAVTDTGAPLDDTAAARLLTLPGKVKRVVPTALGSEALDTLTGQRRAAIQRTVSERNAGFFEAEAAKLESWSDDLKIGLEREIKELERLIKEARREAITALTLEAKLAAQKRIRSLESTRNDKRRSLFEAQDRVDRQRDELISAIEGKLTQGTGTLPLFTLRWTLTA